LDVIHTGIKGSKPLELTGFFAVKKVALLFLLLFQTGKKKYPPSSGGEEKPNNCFNSTATASVPGSIAPGWQYYGLMYCDGNTSEAPYCDGDLGQWVQIPPIRSSLAVYAVAWNPDHRPKRTRSHQYLGLYLSRLIREAKSNCWLYVADVVSNTITRAVWGPGASPGNFWRIR
jgi:hypothetical protein